MTLENFNQLNYEEKATCLWESGNYASNYVTGNFRVILYLLHDFYVEIYYHVLLNEVCLVSAFEDAEALTPYIEHIDVERLLDRCSGASN